MLGSNQASLTWTASNGAGSAGFGYDIEVDIDGAGFNQIIGTGNLFYTDTQGSANGETYMYRIVPYNDYGEGPVSNEVGVVLPGESEGPVFAEPPSLLDRDFTLSWSSVAGAAFYDLYASQTRFGTYSLWEEDIADTEFLIDHDAAFGVASYWYVVAHDGAGHYSLNSSVLECTPVMASSASRILLNSGNNILLNAGGTLLMN